MKVAIVHEMLVKLWWAEKVVTSLLRIFPEADVYTLMYDEEKMGNDFPKASIAPAVFSLPSQKVFTLLKNQRLCLLFMARSIEQLDFSEYDLVIASSSAFAHGAITKPDTAFLVYSHSPARYLWDWTNEYKRDIGWKKSLKWFLMNKVFLKLRQWDYMAGQRSDLILANSQNTKQRIRKYHRREAEVLYPPVETERFSKKLELTDILLKKTWLEKWKYYVIISALTEFKKLDIAINAFQHFADVKLVIIGQWEHKAKLEKQAGENIMFAWAKYGDELVAFVQNSLWLIFPGEEDFGIVPIEAMAAGKPVFALRKWWLVETVVDEKTWAFFNEIDGNDFIENFQLFHTQNLKGIYSPEDCKNQAEKFSEAIFKSQLLEHIDKVKNKTINM